jgi:hypothetical protein
MFEIINGLLSPISLVYTHETIVRYRTARTMEYISLLQTDGVITVDEMETLQASVSVSETTFRTFPKGTYEDIKELITIISSNTNA